MRLRYSSPVLRLRHSCVQSVEALLGSLERLGNCTMNTLEFLAQVSASIKANGKFVGGKDAKANGGATTGDDAAFAIMDGETNFDASDLALAEEALAWARGYEGDNKFLSALRVKVATDDMLFSNASIAAWVIPAYQDKDNTNADLSSYKDAVFYGSVGGEAAFRGSIVSVITTKGGRFGPQSYVTLADKANHLFLWKTSGDRANGLKAGQAVRVWGTIKEHKDYKGIKQTRLVRPKITLA